ncbi:MAG: hypothetical protein AB7O62_21540 [Pirellulales bacterium]
MIDQTSNEMSDSQTDLAKLKAEVERLRKQSEVAKLKAEAEKLRAEMAAEATASPAAPSKSAATPPARPKTPATPAAKASPEQGKTPSKQNGQSAAASETRIKPSSPPKAPPAKAPPASKQGAKPSQPAATPKSPTSAKSAVPPPAEDVGAAVVPLTAAVDAAVSPPPTAPGAKVEKPVPAKLGADGLPLPEEADDVEPRFGKKFFQSMGAFTISMLVHAILLVAMAMWVVQGVVEQRLEPLQASQARTQEELTKVMSETTDATSEVSLTSSSSSSTSVINSALQSGHGGSLATGGAAPSMAEAMSEALAAGGGPSLNDVGLWGMSDKEMKVNVADGAPGDPSQVVGGYEEAMDRITHEILMSLLKGDVLVMWLFDQSESMKDDQVEIRERFDRVYQELGITPQAKGDHLLTAIGSYGKDFMLHTQKPTSKLSEIRAAIDSIPIDPSGLENMCPAVGLMINRHRKFASQGKRRVMLIMVTDESGEQEDNERNLEIAIDEAKASRCPIYLLGREAVFGYPYAYMNWIEPESKLNFWLQINRGPETPYVEQLQTNGFYRRYDAHASGFGPYEQTRMARETGGIFFLLPSPEVNLVARDDRKYELEAIKPYLPDLSARRVALEQREKSELRRSLWKVISDLNPWNPVVQPHIEMRHQFSIEPAAFYQQMNQEHAKAIQYFVYLDRCEKELERIKKFRDKESSPRWRANYDLLFAQVLAYKVRLYEYGAYMEAFAKNPKKIKNPLGPLKKTTHWELAWRAETLTGDKTASYIERSKRMFEDVIKDHSGTPWASRAQWELARGFGVELVEDYDDPRRVALGAKVPKF